MQDLLDQLKRKNRLKLREILQTSGCLPVRRYAESLYEYDPPCDIEPSLLQAFQEEMRHAHSNSLDVSEVLSFLKRRRVLQTATHLTASEGPTFFAIHWLASLGVPDDGYYVVAAYSGVPFSNSARPGCLNYHSLTISDLLSRECPLYGQLVKSELDREKLTDEKRISLVPSTYRNSLVYRSPFPEKALTILPYLCSQLKRFQPSSDESQSYATWALRFSNGVMQDLCAKENIVFIDFNELITSYLLHVIPDVNHLIHHYLFNPKLQGDIIGVFGNDIPVFYHQYHSRSVRRWEFLYIRDNHLVGSHIRLPLTPENVHMGLADGRLCPARFLSFTILSFLNGFKSLGSFEHVEYLSQLRNLWRKTGLFSSSIFEREMIGLTCGRFVDDDNEPVFPLDVVLGIPWQPPRQLSLYEIIEPISKKIASLPAPVL